MLRERGSGTLDILLAALQKHNIKLSDLNVKMYLGSTESIKLFLENCDCLGILSIRSVNKELYAGEMKVLEIKDLSMFREFDFVQLQGQEPIHLDRFFVNGLYPGIGPFLTLGHSTGSFIPRFDIRIGVWSGSSQVQ